MERKLKVGDSFGVYTFYVNLFGVRTNYTAIDKVYRIPLIAKQIGKLTITKLKKPLAFE